VKTIETQRWACRIHVFRFNAYPFLGTPRWARAVREPGTYRSMQIVVTAGE
jgi:hypothetical protein